MINLSPTNAANEEMQQRGSLHRVWIRRMEMHEIPDLLEIGLPSDTNRDLWERTKRERLAGSDAPLIWYGGQTLAETSAMLKTGYTKGAKKAAELARQIEREMPDPVSRKRKLIWSDNGDEIDRDRIYSGQIEVAWRTTKRKPQRAPQVISIAVPWGDNCGTGNEEMFWPAAAAIALTDLLEKAGYSVDLRAISVGHHYDDGSHYTGLEITVKHPNEPLRPDAVAAVFHAGSFRYFGIPAIAGTPNPINDGYGSCQGLENGMPILTAAKLTDPAHLALKHVYSGDAAKTEVLRQLKLLESGNFMALESD